MKVIAGGTFSLLHPGHIYFLKNAKKKGDSLVVVVAHDSTVTRKKGRPTFTAKERADMIRSLRFVDKVVIGHHNDMMGVVRREKPGTIALGFDQDEAPIKEGLERIKYKCKIVRIKKLPGYSTSRIVKEIKQG